MRKHTLCVHYGQLSYERYHDRWQHLQRTPLVQLHHMTQVHVLLQADQIHLDQTSPHLGLQVTHRLQHPVTESWISISGMYASYLKSETQSLKQQPELHYKFDHFIENYLTDTTFR